MILKRALLGELLLNEALDLIATAATVFTPSRKITCASFPLVREPSPWSCRRLLRLKLLRRLPCTICAPMFSLPSLSSISFATVTPSFVIVVLPYFFSSTTLRPFGPRVIFTASAS